MPGYRYLLDGSVAEDFLTLPTRHREPLLGVFRQIADDPCQSGRAAFRDSDGREIFQQQIGMWKITFWPDHAVKEVRIVGVRKIGR